MSLSISKIAQGTSVQRRDRGPSHKQLRIFWEFNHLTEVSPSYELRHFCFASKRKLPKFSDLVACHGVRNIGCIKLWTNDSTTLKRVIKKYTACSTLLDNLQSAHYHFAQGKANRPGEVFWVDVPMPEKLDEKHPIASCSTSHDSRLQSSHRTRKWNMLKMSC